MHPDCRCPMCRRFPRTMKKISEMEGKPMSAESRAKLQEIVADAYRQMGRRIAASAEANGGAST